MEKLNFSAVYNEYRPLVMARLRTKIRSNEEREDVCQDIFMKVLNFLRYIIATRQNSIRGYSPL